MKPMNDMIELSDHFRRSAELDHHDAVVDLVALTRKFANEVTWIDLTYPRENEINRKTAELQRGLLEKMVAAGQAAGLSRIVLPLHKDSPFAQFVQEEVLNKNEFDLPMTFRTADYKRDLASLGDINPAIETALDEGVRGVCAIDSDLKYKWDSDMRPAVA